MENRMKLAKKFLKIFFIFTIKSPQQLTFMNINPTYKVKAKSFIDL